MTLIPAVPRGLFLCLVLTSLTIPSRGEANAAARARPFLLHLNGVGGERTIDKVLVRGLQQGGYEGDVQFYDWTGGQIGLEALRAYDLHKAEARKVADILLARIAAHPGSPVYITAHSGGAGVAAFALELLPDDIAVDAVFMFAPALSPEYDLSKMLRHVKKNLYVFSSPHDTVVLAAGTKLFGTIDGIKCEAAGLNGFVKPAAAEAELYRKLLHFPYQRNWLLKYGNAGSHICCMRLKFARDFIAPLLLTGRTPDDGAAPSTQPALATPLAK